VTKVPVGRLAPRARAPAIASSATFGRIQATSEWQGSLNSSRKAILRLENVHFSHELVWAVTTEKQHANHEIL